jgi:hypothetical protein
MRWLLPLLGAYAAGRLAEVSLLIVWGIAGTRLLLGPAVTYPAFIVAFLATLFPLLMFMGNLSARVAVWTANRRIGPGERIPGGLLGIACGLILVAAAIDLTPIRRAQESEPAWLGGSALLPYFRSLSEALERTLSFTPTSSRRRLGL